MDKGFKITRSKGKSLREIIDTQKGHKEDYFCALVDNVLRELPFAIEDNQEHIIVPLNCKDPTANKVYEGSLRYLIGMAVDSIKPRLRAIISYGVSRSLFVRFSEKKTDKSVVVDNEFKDKLQAEMQRLVKADLTISRKTVTKKDALKLYEEHGLNDRLASLVYRPENTVHLYFCQDYFDYPYCHMVPSTGYLGQFKIARMSGGLAISYPRYDQDGEIPLLEADKNYSRALRENFFWAQTAGLDTVAKINGFLQVYGEVALVSVSEAYIDLQFAHVTDAIKARSPDLSFICIAGPSSSGKTTFAKKLRTWLMAYGLRPLRVSIDDYYRERQPDENVDFEDLEALDIARFDKDMKALAQGKEVFLPSYNFATGKAVYKNRVKLVKHQPIIIEGIHALNPQLTPSIPPKQKFGIYISSQAQVSIDDHNPMSLTDTRLLRRIVRDSWSRGTSAAKTIAMWQQVRAGEFKHIYPYESNADFVFNSYLSYETCALKEKALKFLGKIKEDSPSYVGAERLRKFLKYFPTLHTECIPADSLMKEFTGGSIYEDDYQCGGK